MSFTEHNVNGLIYDTSDVITAAGSGAVHAFTTRHGGVSPAPYDSLNFADNKGDTSENLLENYRRLGEAVGFDASRAVGCRQIHSDLVRIASEEDAGKILWDDRPYDADGLITNVPNLPLFAYGTDCCVITLYDPTSRSIGAVHAGWRGTPIPTHCAPPSARASASAALRPTATWPTPFSPCSTPRWTSASKSAATNTTST